MFKTEIVLCPVEREHRRQLSLCTDLKAFFHQIYFMMKQVYYVLFIDKKNKDSIWQLEPTSGLFSAKQKIVKCLSSSESVWGYHILEFKTYSKQMTDMQ